MAIQSLRSSAILRRSSITLAAVSPAMSAADIAGLVHQPVLPSSVVGGTGTRVKTRLELDHLTDAF